MDLTTKTLLTLPGNFGLHDLDHPVRLDPARWALGPVFRTRDSSLLETSNACALIRHLEAHPALAEDWQVTPASHWAVGWVDHLSFRVFDVDGEETAIYHLIRQWFDGLADYPIADEEDFSRREDEALYASVAQSGQRYVRGAVGDEWVEAVLRHLGEHDPSQLESRGNNGPSPDDDAVFDALLELDMVERDEEAD